MAQEIRRLARTGNRARQRPERRSAPRGAPKEAQPSRGAHGAKDPGEGASPRATAPDSMPLANQLAVSIAALAGFLLGLLEAFNRMPYARTLTLGAIGLAIALLCGLAGVVDGRSRPGERILVSTLRAGLSGGVFVFVFDGMRLLLKIGDVAGALAAWVGAGILALILARLAPARDVHAASTHAATASTDRLRTTSSPPRPTGRPPSVARARSPVSGPGRAGTAQGTPRPATSRTSANPSPAPIEESV